MTHPPTGGSGSGGSNGGATGPGRVVRQTADCLRAWGRVALAVAELTVSLSKGGTL